MSRLEEEGFAEGTEDYRRAVEKWQEGGAIWSIFDPKDNDTIRAFIHEVATSLEGSILFHSFLLTLPSCSMHSARIIFVE